MRVLVTGGAGYIGSHVVKHLIEAKTYEVTILDNLITGFKSTVDKLQKLDDTVRFIEQDLSDWDAVTDIINKGKYDAVIHFAASLVVPESVTEPLKYYLNNTANTANLVKCCIAGGVNKFIFSSTAAVYGEPEAGLAACIDESAPLSPINPYGRSKMFSEYVLRDSASANPDFKFVILRYFNVAGSDKDGLIGLSTLNATHLIKIAVETALGKREKMYIFGDDYETPDGTCVRDYIHVDDLASAHVSSLEYLIQGGDSDIFNCGYGRGFSVNEVIDIMREVSGVTIAAEVSERRPGDPSVVVSDNSKITSTIDWKPKYDDLKYICKTALEWEKKL